MAGVERPTAAPDASIEDTVRIGVPILLAVVTWLLLLLLAGYVLRLSTLSLFNLLPLLVFGILFWPVATFEPWRDGAGSRVRAYLRANRTAILVTLVLAALVVFPFVPDLLSRILALPFRASGIFFGASIFYCERLGATVGQAIFRFGQLYLVFLWLYVLSTVLVSVGRWAR